MFNVNHWLNRFPGTNFHELNIDWLVEAVKDIAKELEHFELVNQISYQGIWNITKNYPAWSIVTDNNDGYISLQPVPYGINITNTDYWVKVANFSAELANLGTRVIAAEADIDELENGSWLYGKKVAWFGDSVSVFMVPRLQVKYPHTTFTATVYNGEPLAVQAPGSLVNGYTRLMAADLSTFDYVFIAYGINDWQGSIPLDTKTHDQYCFGGALDAVLSHIKSTYKKCVPVVMFPTWVHKQFYGVDHNINGAYTSIEGYINHGIDICNKYHVEYINMYTITGVNESNYTEMLRDDVDHVTFVHPTEKTLDIMERAIYEHVINTGKTFGEAWGGNHATNCIGTLQPTVSEYSAAIKPLLKFGADLVPDSLHNQVNSSDDELIFKISGFLTSTGDNAPIMNIKTFDDTDTEIDTTILGVVPAGNHAEYFEAYTKISRCEYFMVYFTNIPDSPYLLIENFNIQILNGTQDVYTISASPVPNSTYATLSPNTPVPQIYIKNGIINQECFTLDITADAASDAELATMPNIYPGQNYGMALKGASDVLYVSLISNKLKTLGSLSTGNFVTIPATCSPLRTHYTS